MICFLILLQPFDDPFGDGPFKAITNTDGAPTEQQIHTPTTSSFNANSSQTLDMPQAVPQKPATDAGAAFYDTTNTPFGMQPTTSTPFTQQESSTPSLDIDILADILPPSEPQSFASAQQTGYQVAPNQSVPHGGFNPQTNQQYPPQNGYHAQPGQPAFPTQLGQPSLQGNYPPQHTDSVSQSGYPSQNMSLVPSVQPSQVPHAGFHTQGGPPQPNPNFYGAYQQQSVAAAPGGGYMVPPSSTGFATSQNFLSNTGSAAPVASHMGSQAPQVQSSSLVSSATASAVAPKPSSDKFETKSTVWADTLSRGLVNLNISGCKFA